MPVVLQRMKNTRHILAILTFVVVAQAWVQAQPSVTTATLTFQPGESYVQTICDPLEPGPSGADQVWDFSTIPACGAPRTESWLAPTGSGTIDYTVSQRFNSMSPSAYYRGSSAVFQLVLGAPLPNDGYYYDDLKDVYRFPLEFGDSFTDSFGGTRNAAGTTESFNGTRTVTYDAFGTISVPGWGSFTDVVRLHVEETIELAVSDFLSQEMDEYLFFRAGVHEPVLRIVSTTSLSGGSVGGYSILQVAPNTGIEPAGLSTSALFSPNPATDFTTVRTQQLVTSAVALAVDGRSVPLNLISNGQGAYRLDVSALPCGVHVAILSGPDGKVVQRFVKQ